MNKLISKNPILRFKLGLKIEKFLNAGKVYYKGRDGINYEAWRGGDDWYYRQRGTSGMTKMPHNYVTTSGVRFYRTSPKGGAIANSFKTVSSTANVRPNADGLTNTINNRIIDGGEYLSGDGVVITAKKSNKNTSSLSRKRTKANTRTNNVQTTTLPQAKTSSSNTPTLSNTYVEYATPETSKVQNVNLSWTYRAGNTSGGFVPTQSSALQSVTLQLDEGPSFYGEGLTDFNRGSIRGFRNLDGGFRNVDEYYNWLNNNRDSDLYKLWNNVLEGMDEETRRNTFNQIMNLFGISGNLGRRDSGRLANVLNILRDLGVNGSTNLTAFMNSYRTALNNELTEGRRNASPITSYTEQFRNLILNSKPSLATPPFIATPRYDENGRPLAYSYKQGGLISKNPVKLFKQISGKNITIMLRN